MFHGLLAGKVGQAPPDDAVVVVVGAAVVVVVGAAVVVVVGFTVVVVGFTVVVVRRDVVVVGFLVAVAPLPGSQAFTTPARSATAMPTAAIRRRVTSAPSPMGPPSAQPAQSLSRTRRRRHQGGAASFELTTCGRSGGEARTPDKSVNSRSLYQLSYPGPISHSDRASRTAPHEASDDSSAAIRPMIDRCVREQPYTTVAHPIGCFDRLMLGSGTAR